MEGPDLGGGADWARVGDLGGAVLDLGGAPECHTHTLSRQLIGAYYPIAPVR